MKKIKWKLFSIILTATLILGAIFSPAEFTPKVQAADQPSETMQGAIPIELGNNASCTFNGKYTEAHYFKFTVPQNIGNQWITLSATNYTNHDMLFYLLDSQGSILCKSDNITEQSTFTFETRTEGADTLLNETHILSPGNTYFLKVFAYYTSGDVTVSVASKKDDNWGTYGKADKVTAGKWKNGKLEKWDDIDCFSIKLPKNNRKYVFNIYSDNYIKAFFVNTNRVTLSEVSVDANKTNNNFVTKGKGQTIYIRLQTRDNTITSANYSLKVSVQKKTISKLSLAKLKRNQKTISGKTISNANIKIKISKQTYTAKSNKSGNFTIKLKKRLKANDKIKIYVSKSGYKTCTKTYKVK